MSVSPRILAALPLLLLSSPALAAPASSTAPNEVPAAEGVGADAHESEKPPVPRAKDLLGGHFQLGAGGLLTAPFARLDDATSFRDTAEAGAGISLDLGIGLSRGVVAGAFFQYVAYRESDDCSSCDPSSLGIGAFVRYHLVQGARFDPWTSLGLGYRKLDTGLADYSGVEWLRFSLGGDWYALSNVGFGPYVELNLGTFTKRPENTDAAVYASFGGGLRLAFDLPGK